MIRFFQNFIKPKKAQLHKGQISVVLILFFAILLMTLGVVINLGKASQIKTHMTLAADSAAAFMGSSMASYSESLFQEVIKRGPNDGHEHLSKNIADWGIWGKILGVVIAIIALILTCTGVLAAPGAILFAVAAVVISTTALVLQVTVVEPSVASMWGKMFANIPMADQIQENAINIIFQKASNDSVLVPDIMDMDQDGYYYGDGTEIGDKEKVGRFSFLYSQRATQVAGEVSPQSGVAGNFLKALAEFVYDEPLQSDGSAWFTWDPAWTLPPDGWAVLDGKVQDCPNVGYFKNECDLGCGPTGTAATCDDNGTPWRYSYNPHYENGFNDFESFREFIGRDDENPAIYFDPQPKGVAVAVDISSLPAYLERDSLGLYNLLWRMDRVSLNVSDYPPNDNRYCEWCADDDNTGLSQCLNQGGFDLGAQTTSNSNCNSDNMGGCCINPNLDEARGETLDPRDNDFCYVNEPYNFSWKKGILKYLAHTMPYSQGPGKNCDSSCIFNSDFSCCTSNAPIDICTPDFTGCEPNWSCGFDGAGNAAGNTALWREDTIDVFRYGDSGISIDSFLGWAKEVLKTDPNLLVYDLGWKEDFDYWFGSSQGIVAKLLSWKESVNKILTELMQYTTSSLSTGDVCEGTLEEVEGCYDEILEDINTCHADCVNNTSTCEALSYKLRFDQSFEEPPPQNPYDPMYGQATGCEVSNSTHGPEEYSFMRALMMWKEKIEHRKEFLFGQNSDGGVYYEALDSIVKLTAARNKIEEFLDDPRVIMMIEYLNSTSSSFSFEHSMAVYAWQDEASEDGSDPKWHIVRVEANLPTKCSGNCGRTSCEGPPAGVCREPELPWIKKWEASWAATKDWYSLIDYSGKGRCGQGNRTDKKNRKSYKDPGRCFKGGLTKARVVRYDEGGDVLKWATNKEFWKMIFKNPKASANTNPDLIEDMDKCGMLLGAAGGSIDGGGSFGMEGAVMLSQPSEQNQACWNLLTELLKMGSEARSCTEYYYTKDPNRESMFKTKFVTCPSDAF